MKKIFTKKMTILFASVLFSGATAFATVDIEANETYTQNFDGIGTAATATLPTGWKADKSNSFGFWSEKWLTRRRLEAAVGG